jgi:prepilin-type N-terminal cleavage/methylation domain-containing protein
MKNVSWTKEYMLHLPLSPESDRRPGGPERRWHWQGFTLVELLVSLLVLTVLAAFLFPALGRSKAKVKDVRCLSNLRQIYLGFSLYTGDNQGRFPAGFEWGRRIWNPSEFVGGQDPRDSKWPPARVRPLFRYLGASEVFHCPADAGFDDRPEGGPLISPTLFAVAGTSYRYNSGNLEDDESPMTDGLGGKTIEWVKRRAKYLLVYEPPGVGGRLDSPGAISVYWHCARKPGSGPAGSDQERGPRFSSFLFADGHTSFIDCSYSYGGVPFGIERVQR